MKQKTNNKTPITKEELTETLTYYPTKEELKKAKSKLKAELKEASRKLGIKLEKNFVDRMVTGQAASRAESDYKFSLMQEDLDSKFSSFANRILIAIDPLLQELKTRQQEREIAAAQINEVRGSIDNHEKRITKLEHS